MLVNRLQPTNFRSTSQTCHHVPLVDNHCLHIWLCARPWIKIRRSRRCRPSFQTFCLQQGNTKYVLCCGSQACAGTPSGARLSKVQKHNACFVTFSVQTILFLRSSIDATLGMGNLRHPSRQEQKKLESNHFVGSLRSYRWRVGFPLPTGTVMGTKQAQRIHRGWSVALKTCIRDGP